MLNKKDKELLIRDLCARLPFGVECEMYDISNPNEKIVEELKIGGLDAVMNGQFEAIPFLRPLGDMTDEEHIELLSIVSQNLDGGKTQEDIDNPSEWRLYDNCGIQNCMGGARFYFDEIMLIFHWLYKHQFNINLPDNLYHKKLIKN
jgi:hypothetical protein